MGREQQSGERDEHGGAGEGSHLQPHGKADGGGQGAVGREGGWGSVALQTCND
jgi:hypothetical protein